MDSQKPVKSSTRPTASTSKEENTSRIDQMKQQVTIAADATKQHARKGMLVAALVVVAVASGFVGAKLAAPEAYITTNTLAGQQQIVTSQGELINRIAKEVGPSVVSITTTTQTQTTDFWGYSTGTSDQQAAGTGIIISKSGVIMTNRHVVPAGTTEVSVTLSDGTQFENVEVLGRTSSSDSIDIAFLKIKNLNGYALTPAVIGHSSAAQIGDSVVAIGNALGQFQNTVTSGIISGFGRQVVASSGDGTSGANSEDLGNLIQTDAAINQGNSGGPLVNMNGEVIGVNTAVASGAENIGFSIPIDDIKSLIDQVLKTGTFARPYLGVRYVTLSEALQKAYALPRSEGAYLAPIGFTGKESVMAGSPADKAGLKSGDIITEVDGKKVTQKTNLTTLLNKYGPNDSVKLTVYRDGKVITINATLGSSKATKN